jgi:hypothetical protein
VSDLMALEVPSSTLRGRIAVATEEGVELEARLRAFAATAHEVLTDFDAEVDIGDLPGLDLDDVVDPLVPLEQLIKDMADATSGLLHRVLPTSRDHEEAVA